MAFVNGSVLDSYEAYEKTISSLTNILTGNTSINVERFARSIVIAVDRLYDEYGFHAFVKLDAAGAGGWSCVIGIYVVIQIRLINEQLFKFYTNICDKFANNLYKMYPFSTNYAYFGQKNDGNFLKFNFIINSFLFVDNQQKLLPKNQHRKQVYNIVKQITSRHIYLIVN